MSADHIAFCVHCGERTPAPARLLCPACELACTPDCTAGHLRGRTVVTPAILTTNSEGEPLGVIGEMTGTAGQAAWLTDLDTATAEAYREQGLNRP